MDKAFYMHVTVGLILVGFLLILTGLLAEKMGDLRTGTEAGKGKFYDKENYRFRRGGFIVMGVAVGGFVALCFSPNFTQFPSERFIFTVNDLVMVGVAAPWGRVNVLAAILALAIGVFLFFSGMEHWRMRRNYIRAILCYVIALFVIIEGVFQLGR